MNNDTLNYTKFKTVIYTPSGYYGSEYLWNDASYAFRHCWKENDTTNSWQYLTTNKEYLREKLGLEIGVLPEWDYEYITLPLTD